MFSQTTEYALRAMASLAPRPNQLIATPHLAKSAHVPPNYLAKVLQQLAAAGLISGRRGVGGGYKLARPPAEINLLDIVNAIGEIKGVRDRPTCVAMHAKEIRALHRRTDAALAAVINIYKNTTLDDLLTDETPDRPLCSKHNGMDAGVIGRITNEPSPPPDDSPEA